LVVDSPDKKAIRTSVDTGVFVKYVIRAASETVVGNGGTGETGGVA
jgi:hypothetical protein